MTGELTARARSGRAAIIDGQIHSARYEHLLAERGPDLMLEPAAMAQTYIALHRQPRRAWTHELDLRLRSETF